ncbi:LTA synthase family protein [Luteibacter aegosomatis]|uniref:LTA synthase family protein n=1 Tax=Luteibacter aegosomatis TaxID=2911537 RepID=UPI001FFB3BA4|nr:LTA synthase family protein [Luteibacter aegosomatis]UPG86541.1 LTA synthase family protein [Luteibacter aegosomatis]
MQNVVGSAARPGGSRSMSSWAKGASGCVVLIALSWVLDRYSLRLDWGAYLFSRGFFAGILPLLAVYGILLAITNRPWLASLLQAALLVALFVANMKKVEYLHSTVMPTDYFFVKGLDTSSITLLGHYVDVPVVSASAVVLLGVAVLGWRYEAPIFKNHRLARATSLIASIALGWWLLSASRFVERVYDEDALGITYQSMASQLHAGLLSSLVYWNLANQKALDVQPDPVAAGELLALEKATFPPGVAEGSGAATAPDIVVVQSESFFDPALMQGVDTDELLPHLHRAQRETGVRDMTVPTFGGGTLRSEFEFLTGIPLEAYPDLQFPYLQISKPRIEGIVSALNDAGYSTTAIHPNSGQFWNRRATFQAMGFQKFIARKAFPSSAYGDGLYLSDRSMTDQIIDSLEKSHSPSFIFAISIEAHGPYRHMPVRNEAERAARSVPAAWPDKAADEFRTYTYHIRHADEELGRLWTYLKQRRRPYLLVFYGDHLPGLEFVYQAGGFRNGLSPYEQNVPWVILSSEPPVDSMSPRHIYAWMLADEIFRQAGLREPSYFRVVGNAGRLLEQGGGAPRQEIRPGLQSVARMRLAGRFDAFYGSQAHED